MKKVKVLSILFIVVIFIVTLFSSFSFAQESNQKFTFKAAHYFTKDHPWNKGLEYFAKKVSEDSKGRIEIKIFNNGVLGSEQDVLKLVREGAIDFVVSDPSAGSTFAKELDFFSLPFIFNSYENWQKSMYGKPGQEYSKIIENKTGLKIIGYFGGSSRNLLSTKKPVKSINDLKGFVLRLIASPLKLNFWKGVGTIPTPIAYLETYSALQSGVVDGMENESVCIRDMKFYEPAPYITRTEHEFTVRPLFMSMKTFDKLSSDLQQVILTDAKEAAVYENEVERKVTGDAEKEMEEKYGVKFFTINKEPFEAIAKPIKEKFAKEAELTELLQEISNIK